MAKHKKSVFAGTHRPIRGERRHRSMEDARREASFDNVPSGGCWFPALMILSALGTMALAAIGVIL